jgi:DNA-directed RNA polymerase subunit alpha
MSILAFQMPEKVAMEKSDDFHGLFTFNHWKKDMELRLAMR